jgi:hypothetical protein
MLARRGSRIDAADINDGELIDMNPASDQLALS